MSLPQMSALGVRVIQLLVTDILDCVVRDVTLVVDTYLYFVGT
jgi:hypothetical protein